MAYSQLYAVAGKQQEGYFYQVDTTQREVLGARVQGVDNYFGYGEFMYVQFPASAAITQGQVLVVSGFGGSAGYSAAVAPTTANTGRAIAICFNAVASVASVQYGWVMVGGNAVIKAAASVAAGVTFGIDASTAGSVNANSAGRQVLNAVSVAPSTTAIVQANAGLTNGSPRIQLPNVDGLVPGLAISGTGVSGTILSINLNSREITSTANSTAGGVASVTFTYTGFIVGMIDRSSLQGAIT
jgi:hypothetical protein